MNTTPSPLTADEKRRLQELPWLIRRKDVHRVFGLSDQALKKAVDAGELHFVTPGGGRRRYFKAELLAYCRVKI